MAVYITLALFIYELVQLILRRGLRERNWESIYISF
jgi:hypothetical protein